ncbi:MAG TPA: serine hydrolase [Nocardioides sp.]|nr:serine hydrolase [Nocardioides sp.]
MLSLGLRSLAWTFTGTLTASLVVVAPLDLTSAGAATPPGGHVSRAPISTGQLLRGAVPTSLSNNSRFAAPSNAKSAPPLRGTLRLSGAVMHVLGDGQHRHRIADPVLGKDTTLFPAARIPFFSDGPHLVPTSQDVIRVGSLRHTRSYWDLLVQPGRRWTQPGDHGWHRASFPFELVNSIEGETHTGIAMFLYRGHRVSPVRFQIVQQTSPYLVTQYFSAWGTSRATLTRGVAHVREARHRYVRSQQARLPHRPWSALRDRVGARTRNAFRDFSDVVQSAVDIDGTVYRTPCPTAAGPFPYCDDVRYGVWSVTKSAMLNVALLRLAQKYGAGILRSRISRLLPGRQPRSWHDVTVEDLANMASGHGPAAHPHCYLCDYSRWYVARSERHKTTEALDYRRFAKPGTVYNYRDQDAYLLGVVEAHLLKAEAGSHADLWTMRRREVYRRIGIFYAPANSTIEPRRPRSAGHPLMAYGYYPTVDDLAKIAALYAHHGRWHGRQILDRRLVDRLLPRPRPAKAALQATKSGSHFYLDDWHIRRLVSAEGCTRYVPQMLGWGGNTVTVAGAHATLIRIRNNWVGDRVNAQTSINQLADALVSYCR